MAHFLDKIQFYLLYGVRLVWVFDPATSTVTVQVPGQEARILSAGDVLHGEPGHGAEAPVGPRRTAA